MGNKSSAPSSEDPYKILGVDRSASKKEIRRKYTEMLLKYHPTRNKTSDDEKVIKIKEAYRSILENRVKDMQKVEEINLDPYTEDYFRGLGRDFYTTVSHLFEMLCEQEPEASYPKFGNASSKNFESFYGFFKKFRTQRTLSRNKVENRAMQKTFNTKVRNIVGYIAKHDERLKTVISEKHISEDYAVKQKKRRAKRKDTEFVCNLCSKGFRSKNQALSHLKSKRHVEKVSSVVSDHEAYIKGEEADICAREDAQGQAGASTSSADAPEEPQERIIQENEKVLQELYAKVSRVRVAIEDAEDKEVAIAFDENVKVAGKESPGTAKGVPVRKPPKSKKKGARQNLPRKKKRRSDNFVSNESVHFLTCVTCKKRFESRNKLFMHLREENHSKP